MYTRRHYIFDYIYPCIGKRYRRLKREQRQRAQMQIRET